MALRDTSKINTPKNKKLTVSSVTLQSQSLEQNSHIPVLTDEVLALLAPKAQETYLDVTAGYGGHANHVTQTVAQENLSLIDRDEQATRVLKRMFPKADIYEGDFAQILDKLNRQSCRYDMILADLGVSSPQIDDSSRGFSFLKDAPLDMRMDQSSGSTVADALRHMSLLELTTVLKDYGQEPKAAAIAQAIKRYKPTTTLELAAVVKRVRFGRSKKHPATKTFQALRVYINQEPQQLSGLLSLAPQLLPPKGRLAIISFQSLEDKLVKHTFRDLANSGYDSEYRLLTKKPVRPSQQEIAFNPRSRSAKLRVLQRK